MTGVVVDKRRGESDGLKTVARVLDPEPILAPDLLKLGLWISDYYFAPLGEALRVMLPPSLLSTRSARGQQAKQPWPVRKLQAVVRIHSTSEKLSPRQQEVLRFLQAQKLPVPVQDVVRKANCSSAVITMLVEKAVLSVEAIEVTRSPWTEEVKASNPHSLMPGQRQIVDKIVKLLEKRQFASLLLHGVTASGKTEIYLQAIREVLKSGQSALALVPEIGLTPQLSRQFRSWFGSQVAILHSGLSAGERFDQWRRIRSGAARVVVGTRSAVFAPVVRLGLMIVDEEHDSSYKQGELPRYHARDAALKRGQMEGAVVVLGSATPQLETYYRAREKGIHHLAALNSRILDRPLPTVHIVDMRVEFQKHGRAVILADLLREAIGSRLHDGEQVLILLNRRGYSSAVLCRSCGHTELCTNCSISLTYHQDLDRLNCHYCGYARSVPSRCSQCGKEFIYFLGEGTEKVQEWLCRHFPEARVDRLDRDRVRRKGSFERVLGDFARGKTDILVGTQMIAKGHDFPNVTLVGVLGADQGLRMADFRAAERTFQLLTQVSGRAGRGDRSGDVIIQTYYPNHYSLKHACRQNYVNFYQSELSFRKRFRYPPFTALANLLITGTIRQQAWELAQEVAAHLLHFRRETSSPERMRVLGPAPAAREKLKKGFRFQILIKTTSRAELRKVLRHTMNQLACQKKKLKSVTIDIDPIDLM